MRSGLTLVPRRQKRPAPDPHRGGGVLQKGVQAIPEAKHNGGETLLHGTEQRNQHALVLLLQQVQQGPLRGGAPLGPVAQDQRGPTRPRVGQVTVHQIRLRPCARPQGEQGYKQGVRQGPGTRRQLLGQAPAASVIQGQARDQSRRPIVDLPSGQELSNGLKDLLPVRQRTLFVTSP